MPETVSRMLGAEPTTCQQKGQEIMGRSTGRIRIARTGMWTLQAKTREPEDLCGQIDEILGQLTNDLAVWADLGRQWRVDLFCGLFMGSGNDGCSLAPKQLPTLGERGIDLNMDIYDSIDWDPHAVVPRNARNG